MNATQKLTCPDCGGTGMAKYRPGPCRTCDGAKKVTIDPDAILRAIRSTQGPNRGKLRVANSGMDKVYGATFVWRFARFHGGEDVSMPVMAFFDIGCGALATKATRAVEAILDELACQVARDEFGTDMAAAAAWSGVLR